MIYTVTLNPSIDYYMDIASLKTGAVNRSSDELITYGGKGINVSRMLNQLDCANRAIAAVAGDTGDALIRGLRAEGIDVLPIHTTGSTRINVKLKDGTELNGAGSVAGEPVLDELKALLQNVCKEDIVVFSGSICRGISPDDYAGLIADAGRQGARVVVDSTGAVLKEVIRKDIFLIKPNIEELSELVGTNITSPREAADYALRLTQTGIDNVLVSLGENGALLASKDRIYYSHAPEVKVFSSVCAGDCMLAGFIAAYLNGASKQEALLYAVACGSARVSCKNAFPSKAIVLELYNEITKI